MEYLLPAELRQEIAAVCFQHKLTDIAVYIFRMFAVSGAVLADPGWCWLGVTLGNSNLDYG